MMKKSIKIAFLVFSFSGVASGQTFYATEDDSGYKYVSAHMEWCRGDWGFNEGAQSAVNISNSIAYVFTQTNPIVQVVGLVNNIDYHIAGNLLKRPIVIDAARIAVRAEPYTAVALALTCQYHNDAVLNVLKQNPDLVAAWLRR